MHIELAHPHGPANHSEARARWERPRYKYDVTTTGLVCAPQRQRACWEETEKKKRKKEGSKKTETGDTEHERQEKRTKVRPSLRICFTSSRCEKHSRSHNLKPKISLSIIHCQSSPASSKHMREIQ